MLHHWCIVELLVFVLKYLVYLTDRVKFHVARNDLGILELLVQFENDFSTFLIDRPSNFSNVATKAS